MPFHGLIMSVGMMVIISTNLFQEGISIVAAIAVTRHSRLQPPLPKQNNHRNGNELARLVAVPVTLRKSTTMLRSRDNPRDEYETLSPKTSFGAEAVPEEQRPVNEYLDVTKAPLFGWANRPTGSLGLLLRLAVFYLTISVVLCYPIAGATYTEDEYWIQKLAASNVGAISVTLLLLVRLYTGWSYIGSRLTSKVIEFEETGWYDGDIEYKTETELKRDRFLYNSEVKPVVERLRTFLTGAVALFVASIIALNVANTAKPLYDQYNPEMLSQLQYDDKLAETAAQYSGNRPTYCDNRYYRAIANGGQGCK